MYCTCFCLSVCFSLHPPPPSVPSLSPLCMHHCIICFFVYTFIYSRCLIIPQVIYLISSFGGRWEVEERRRRRSREKKGVAEQKDEEGQEGEKQEKQDEEKEDEKQRKKRKKKKRRGRSRKRKSLLSFHYCIRITSYRQKAQQTCRCRVNDFKQFCFPSL